MRSACAVAPAMGSTAEVRVVGGADPKAACERALRRIEDLEARWSRFRPTSDVGRANARPGAARTIEVAAETADVVTLAVAAWRSTGGAFDPTVGAALVRLGYDRSLPDPGVVVRVLGVGRRAPGAGGVRIDAAPGGRALLHLPAGVTLDLGGIGKGRAADLVAEELVADGAAGACVSIGGDLRCFGESPDGPDWRVAVQDAAHPESDALELWLGAGGVATSGRNRRRWPTSRGPAHHLIDPATGEPARLDDLAVTVVAETAAGAEVLATWALVTGRAAEVVPSHGATGLVHGADGWRALPGLERHRPSPLLAEPLPSAGPSFPGSSVPFDAWKQCPAPEPSPSPPPSPARS